MIMIYTDASTLHSHITTALSSAEKRAKSRTIPTHHIETICEAVSTAPHGLIQCDGGHVAKSYRYRAETSYLTVGWLTRHGHKHVSVSACRGDASKVAYGSSACLDRITDRLRAYAAVWPEQARKLTDWLEQRRIRAAIAHLPAPPSRIVTVTPDIGGIVLAQAGGWHRYIGTPSGWLRAPYQYSRERSAWSVLRKLGFPVPRLKRDRVWTEELAAFATLHVIGGE